MQDKVTYLTKKHRKYIKIKWKRVIVAIFLLCFCVCVLVCLIALGNKQIVLAEQNFYFLQLGDFSAKEDAEKKALEVKSSGGAGYILGDAPYKVMATVYSSNLDAEKVCARLNNNGQNAVIYAMSLSSIKIKAQNDIFNKEFSQAISYPISLFSDIYNLNLSFDKKQISVDLALLNVKNFSNKTQKLEKQYKNSEFQEVRDIGKIYENLVITLKKIEESDTIKLSSTLKFALCETIIKIVDGYNKIIV